MQTSEIEARFKKLEAKVRILDDLEAIKRLQRSYGYYLENWMYEEIIDCFADGPDTELNIMVGIYLGKEGVRRYFSGQPERNINPEVLHQVMQLSGVVDVDDKGRTAEGRWYGFGASALPAEDGLRETLTGGIYTVKYIKQDGKWKILKLIWNPNYNCTPTQWWVRPERIAPPDSQLPKPPAPDRPRIIDSRYPTGYIPPFHYPHPVTGKPSSERKHNRALEKKGKNV